MHGIFSVLTLFPSIKLRLGLNALLTFIQNVLEHAVIIAHYVVFFAIMYIFLILIPHLFILPSLHLLCHSILGEDINLPGTYGGLWLASFHQATLTSVLPNMSAISWTQGT